MEGLGHVYRSSAIMRPALLCDQRYRHTGANGVMYFRHCIGLTQEIRYRRSWGRRGHTCPIADICRCETNAGKLRNCLNFDTLKRNMEALGFAIQVIAVALSEREHQKLTTIDGRTPAGRFGRNCQGLSGSAGADNYLVIGRRVLDGG